jgi:hypothetical protein
MDTPKEWARESSNNVAELKTMWRPRRHRHYVCPLSPATFGMAFILLMTAQLASISARAAPAARDQIEIVYSADDKLCGRLVGLYNKLHARRPKAFYLSDVRTEFYRKTGFGPPPWIDHLDPGIRDYYASRNGNPASDVAQFRATGGGYWWGGAFFRADVTGDGRKRLVFVRHTALGHHGDYHVAVWILKPEMDYREKSFGTSQKQVDEIDPDVVDLVVDFRNYGSYPSVKAPDQRIVFPAAPMPSEDSKKLLRAGFVTKAPQEPFSFDGRIYFSAGPPLLGYGLVYRITPEMNAQVVCLTAVRIALDDLKKSQFWK